MTPLTTLRQRVEAAYLDWKRIPSVENLDVLEEADRDLKNAIDELIAEERETA